MDVSQLKRAAERSERRATSCFDDARAFLRAAP
jgi:hypothetical protein